MKFITSFLELIGAQRSFLLFVNIALVAAAPFSGGETSYTGWQLYPTLLAPTLVPIMFFVMSLDVLMNLVFMVDATDDKRRRHKIIMIFNLLTIVVLVLSWAPFYIVLFNP